MQPPHAADCLARASSRAAGLPHPGEQAQRDARAVPHHLRPRLPSLALHPPRMRTPACSHTPLPCECGSRWRATRHQPQGQPSVSVAGPHSHREMPGSILPGPPSPRPDGTQARRTTPEPAGRRLRCAMQPSHEAPAHARARADVCGRRRVRAAAGGARAPDQPALQHAQGAQTAPITRRAGHTRLPA